MRFGNQNPALNRGTTEMLLSCLPRGEGRAAFGANSDTSGEHFSPRELPSKSLGGLIGSRPLSFRLQLVSLHKPRPVRETSVQATHAVGTGTGLMPPFLCTESLKR